MHYGVTSSQFGGDLFDVLAPLEEIVEAHLGGLALPHRRRAGAYLGINVANFMIDNYFQPVGNTDRIAVTGG